MSDSLHDELFNQLKEKDAEIGRLRAALMWSHHHGQIKDHSRHMPTLIRASRFVSLASTEATEEKY